MKLQIVDPEIGSILIFLRHILWKILLMLHSTNWLNYIVLLPLLLEISGNMSIVIQVYDVIDFEIYPSFLTKPFSYITKKSDQKCNISKTKISFKAK